MADSFYPLDSYRTVQVMSQTQVLDVQYVTCQTIPHNLGFAYAVPHESWIAGSGNAILDVIAVQLEDIYSNGQVAGSTPVQDLDANGLLVDYVSIVVSYDRTSQGLPPLTGTVNVPIQAFFNQDTGIGGFTVPGSEAPNQYVVDEYNRLAALAAA